MSRGQRVRMLLAFTAGAIAALTAMVFVWLSALRPEENFHLGRSLEYYLETLESEDEDERKAAHSALGHLDRSHVRRLRRLVRALRTAQTADGKRHLLAALGRLGPPSIPILRRWAHAEDDDEAVAAVSALATAGPLSTPVLTSLLPDPRQSVRRAALGGIRRLGQTAREAAPLLVAILRLEEFDRERESSDASHVTSALEAIGAPALPYLLELLESETTGRALRMRVLGVMESIADPSLVSAIARVLRTAAERAVSEAVSPEEQDAAAEEALVAGRALEAIGLPAVPAYVGLLRETSDSALREHLLGWIDAIAGTSIAEHESRAAALGAASPSTADLVLVPERTSGRRGVVLSGAAIPNSSGRRTTRTVAPASPRVRTARPPVAVSSTRGSPSSRSSSRRSAASAVQTRRRIAPSSSRSRPKELSAAQLRTQLHARPEWIRSLLPELRRSLRTGTESERLLAVALVGKIGPEARALLPLVFEEYARASRRKWAELDAAIWRRSRESGPALLVPRINREFGVLSLHAMRRMGRSGAALLALRASVGKFERRLAALLSLRELGKDASSVGDTLRGAMLDGDRRIRLAAAGALIATGEAAAATAAQLVERLRADLDGLHPNALAQRNSELKRLIEWYSACFAELWPASAPAVLRMADSDEWLLRFAGLKALEQSDLDAVELPLKEELVSRLVRLIESDSTPYDEDERSYVADADGLPPGSRASWSTSSRRHAFSVLTKLGTAGAPIAPRVIDHLLDSRTSSSTIEYLKGLGPAIEGAAETLFELAVERSRRALATSHHALRPITDPERSFLFQAREHALPALTAALDDADPYVRYWAIELVAHIVLDERRSSRSRRVVSRSRGGASPPRRGPAPRSADENDESAPKSHLREYLDLVLALSKDELAETRAVAARIFGAREAWVIGASDEAKRAVARRTVALLGDPQSNVRLQAARSLVGTKELSAEDADGVVDAILREYDRLEGSYVIELRDDQLHYTERATTPPGAADEDVTRAIPRSGLRRMAGRSSRSRQASVRRTLSSRSRSTSRSRSVRVRIPPEAAFFSALVRSAPELGSAMVPRLIHHLETADDATVARILISMLATIRPAYIEIETVLVARWNAAGDDDAKLEEWRDIARLIGEYGAAAKSSLPAIGSQLAVAAGRLAETDGEVATDRAIARVTELFVVLRALGEEGLAIADGLAAHPEARVRYLAAKLFVDLGASAERARTTLDAFEADSEPALRYYARWVRSELQRNEVSSEAELPESGESGEP